MTKAIQENTGYVLGLDIGGSHVTAGLVNLQTRNIEEASVTRRTVDSHATADEILGAWTDTIEGMFKKFPDKFIHLGFAMPGPFDYEQGICLIKGFDKYESLYEMNIRLELAERLQINGALISFRNDAEAFLEGELFGGAAFGFDHAIGITLGTGLGSALSHFGVTVDAELSVTPYKGEKIEEFVSTRGLIRSYRELSGTTMKDAKSIIDRVQEDAHARRAVEIYCEDLSWFLTYFIKREKPDVLVMGGNMAQAFPVYEKQLLQNLSVLDHVPEIKMAELGEFAALIGASCTVEKNEPTYSNTI